MESIKVPYCGKRELAEKLGISKSTVQLRIGEMEASGRYDSYAVIRDGQIVSINILAFLDWMKYRRLWMDKNLKKTVPEYSPQKVARAMGWEIDRITFRRPKVC